MVERDLELEKKVKLLLSFFFSDSIPFNTLLTSVSLRLTLRLRLR